MTNGEILKVVEGLKELIKLKLPLNIKTSYWLARDKQILETVANTITEKQLEIYKKYGHVIENGDIKVEAEFVPDLNKDLEALMAIDNEIPIIKINLTDFGDIQIPFDTLEKIIDIIQN